jgi:hypothetical protein
VGSRPSAEERSAKVMMKSLNNPGESGDRRRWDALVEQAFIPFMVGVCAVVFALQEWLFAAFGSRPHPGIATVVAVIVLFFVVPRIRRSLRFVDRLGKGVQGEKIVAEALEELKAYGYRVFHDLEGEGFNVDHVVIGPAGVFAIETKMRTKPGGRQATVEYDGQRVLVAGLEPDRNPVEQARASARHVSRRLREVTGEPIPVRPVVLFPEWWVWERPGAEVWVLNPKRFVEYLRHGHPQLPTDTVRRFSAIVSDFARLAVKA